MSFQMYVFFPLLKKKIFFYPYLLGLGRKGQKPRIGKKSRCFSPPTKKIHRGDSQRFLTIYPICGSMTLKMENHPENLLWGLNRCHVMIFPS